MPIANASGSGAAERPAGRYFMEWTGLYYTDPDAAPNGRQNRDLTLLVVGTLNGVTHDIGTLVVSVRLANNQLRDFDLTPFQNQGLQVFGNVNPKTVLSKNGVPGFEVVSAEWHPPAS